MTDIHIRVTQETGEMMAFDDEDVEINRCVIEQWINNADDNFYDQIASVIRKCLEKQKNTIEQMSILKPFSFVLENDDKESVEELYLVDDETVIIDPDLMEGLGEDLDAFLEKHKNFHTVPIKAYLPSSLEIDEAREEELSEGRITLFPDTDGCEGFFICRMERDKKDKE